MSLRRMGRHCELNESNGIWDLHHTQTRLINAILIFIEWRCYYIICSAINWWNHYAQEKQEVDKNELYKRRYTKIKQWSN